MDVDHESVADFTLQDALNGPAPFVVIGAGIAGLAAARSLARAGQPVLVLERETRVGGRIFSDHHDGFTVDVGAEFLANFYTQTHHLIDELGLAASRLDIPSSASVIRDGRAHRLWMDLRAAFSPLLPTGDRLSLTRVLADVLLNTSKLDLGAFDRAAPLDTRSISEYARACLPPDTLEYLIQPALSGIFYWTPEHTSQAMLMLLVRAGLSRLDGLRLGSLRGGLGSLPKAIARDLAVVTGAHVNHAFPTEQGWLISGERHGLPFALPARGIICATPATVVPQVFDLDAERAAFFKAIRYSQNITLALGVRGSLPRQVYSMLFPRRESGLLASLTVQSVKGHGFAPEGCDLLTVHMAGPMSHSLFAVSDEQIRDVILHELARLAPSYHPQQHELWSRVYRWEQALPEFDVGHMRRLAHFAAGGIEWDGVAFAGDYLGGPYVEGAIHSGVMAAQRLLKSN